MSRWDSVSWLGCCFRVTACQLQYLANDYDSHWRCDRAIPDVRRLVRDAAEDDLVHPERASLQFRLAIPLFRGLLNQFVHVPGEQVGPGGGAERNYPGG